MKTVKLDEIAEARLGKVITEQIDEIGELEPLTMDDLADIEIVKKHLVKTLLENSELRAENAKLRLDLEVANAGIKLLRMGAGYGG